MGIDQPKFHMSFDEDERKATVKIQYQGKTVFIFTIVQKT